MTEVAALDQAKQRAVSWLLERVDPDGSLRPAEHSIHYYRVPWSLTVAGRTAEAARCLRCGCSVTCGLCQRICTSFAVPCQDDRYQIDREKCHACGMCAQLCPNKNIEMVAEAE